MFDLDLGTLDRGSPGKFLFCHISPYLRTCIRLSPSNFAEGVAFERLMDDMLAISSVKGIENKAKGSNEEMHSSKLQLTGNIANKKTAAKDGAGHLQ